MKLSILIPAYNEEKTVGEVLKRVLTLPLKKEVIVVDNGSVDGTGRAIKKFASNLELVPMRIEKNIGKGHAVREALARATGDVIVIQDADLEYPPEEIPKLVRPILEGKADAVYGTRATASANGMSATHRFGNWFLTSVTCFLYGAKLSDIETGHKAFRREFIGAHELKSNNFEIENEITVTLLRKGCRIVEVPIAYRARELGKKITMLDGVRLFAWLVKTRFGW